MTAPAVQVAPQAPPTAGATPIPLGPTGQPLINPTPATSSPLLALSQYLNGIQNVTSGSSSGDNNNGGAVNPNIQLTLGSGGATGIDQELAIAQKYDPNASIEYYDNSAEGDMPMERIDMNQSLLPAIPAGYTALGRVSDNSDSGGQQEGQHVLNGAQVYTDPNWGLVTPEADINQNYDTHGGGFFKNISNWAPLVVGGFAGLGPLSQIGTGLGTAAAGAASGLGTLGQGALSLLTNPSFGNDPTGFLSGSGGINSLIGILGGMTGIPGAGTIGQAAYGATQGQTPGLSALMSLLAPYLKNSGLGGT
jgi:hypothetical protein